MIKPLKITVTLGTVHESPVKSAWIDMCEKYNIDDYCLDADEGLWDCPIDIDYKDAIKWKLTIPIQ